MTKLKIVGFSGNATRPSRTRGLVAAVLQEIASRDLGETRHLDLIDVGPEFAIATHAGELGQAAREVKSVIEEADVLVVGSPIYKGAYTGLFKHFFDLFDPTSLTHKPVILTATGGSNRHALVIESHLRPLFSFFNVVSVPAGVFATEADFVTHDDIKAGLKPRILEAVGQLERLVSVKPGSAPLLIPAQAVSPIEAVA